MAVDPRELFERGGKDLVQFLEFCVMSIYVDPVFAFLLMEYRMHATIPRALALYDVFCHPQSAARIAATEALSPKDRRLEFDIDRLRANVKEVEEFNATEPEFPRTLLIPPKYLFDQLDKCLAANEDNSLEKASQEYDPDLSPAENLPDGKMNEVQRQFVDHVWQPHLRPHLVKAGFWRIANIG